MEKVKPTPKAKKKDMDKLSKALRENMKRRKKLGGKTKGDA